MQNRTIPLFVGSADALGAINVSPGRDRFDVQFKHQVIFPPEAKNITLEVNSATIWWTVLNIKAGENDAFRFITDNPLVTTDIILEPGLYDVSSLNSGVNNQLVNAGLDSGLITITGDNATQKILLTFSALDQRVEWVPTSFFELTGFESGQFVPAAGFTTGPFSELAPNVANFSDVSNFIVHTNLVQRGIPQGDSTHQAVAIVQITVPPGSQQTFSPFNPIQLDGHQWRNQSFNQASFWITDQLNRPLDFNGEDFTVTLVFKYWVDEHDDPSHE